MTIGEAGSVQGLLDWITGTPKPGTDGPYTEQEALELAAWLADRSYKVIGAGMNGDRVRAAWARRPGTGDGDG